MVCYDDGDVMVDCFVGDGACQVDGEEDGIRFRAGRNVRCFKEETSIVPGVVG